MTTMDGWRQTIGVSFTATVHCVVCGSIHITDYNGPHDLNAATDYVASRIEPLGWRYEYDTARAQGERCTWRCPTHVRQVGAE